MSIITNLFKKKASCSVCGESHVFDFPKTYWQCSFGPVSGSACDTCRSAHANPESLASALSDQIGLDRFERCVIGSGPDVETPIHIFANGHYVKASDWISAKRAAA